MGVEEALDAVAFDELAVEEEEEGTATLIELEDNRVAVGTTVGVFETETAEVVLAIFVFALELVMVEGPELAVADAALDPASFNWRRGLPNSHWFTWLANLSEHTDSK